LGLSPTGCKKNFSITDPLGCTFQMKAPSLLVSYTFPMAPAKTGKSKMMANCMRAADQVRLVWGWLGFEWLRRLSLEGLFRRRECSQRLRNGDLLQLRV
jgi:hypothetical protein